MSNVKASILIFSAQKVPKVRSDLLSYFYTYDFNVIGSFVVKKHSPNFFSNLFSSKSLCIKVESHMYKVTTYLSRLKRTLVASAECNGPWCPAQLYSKVLLSSW